MVAGLEHVVLKSKSRMKRILLISYNFSPEQTGIGKYNGEMISWFARKGYECCVLTGYPYYPEWKVSENYKRKSYWYSKEESNVAEGAGPIEVLRCPMFVPVGASSAGRLFLEITFFISAFLRLLTLMPSRRYDVVISVAPSFLLGLLGLMYRTFRGGTFVYHIQDLQIEAARELQMIRSSALLSILFFIEKLIIRLADVPSTISQGMADRIFLKSGLAPIVFPNWIDTTAFFPLDRTQSARERLGYQSYHKIVLYSGAVGEKQGLDDLLFAALANNDQKDIRFLICGNGPYRDKLIDQAEQMGLTNVQFVALQPASEFNEFLNMADVHLVLQKASAADLTMPSKLGAILSVGGLVLVTARKGTSLYDLVNDHQTGFIIEPDNQRALNRAVATLCNGNFQSMRANARSFAVNSLSRDQVLTNFEKKLGIKVDKKEVRHTELA